MKSRSRARERARARARICLKSGMELKSDKIN